MYLKTLRSLVVSSFLFLLGLPLTFAAPFSDPINFIGNVINDVFNGSYINISGDSAIRFMYWVVLFTIVYFVGVQRAFKSFNEGDSKNIAKKMGLVIGLVLSTAGTFFTPIDTLRFIFQLYSGILVFIVMFAIFGYMFKLCYGKDALKDYPPIAVKIFRILVLLALLLSIILARKYAGIDQLFSFRLVEYIDPFMTVMQIILIGMLIKELFWGWGFGKDSSGSDSHGGSSDSGSSGGHSGGGSSPSSAPGPSASSHSSSDSGPTTSTHKSGWKPWTWFKSEEVLSLKKKIDSLKKLLKDYVKKSEPFVALASDTSIGSHPADSSQPPLGIASNTNKIADVNRRADEVAEIQKAMYAIYTEIVNDAEYGKLSDKVRNDFQTTAKTMSRAVDVFLQAYTKIQKKVYPPVKP